MTSGDTSPARRRLWVVSELYYPEETSTGYYLTRIIAVASLIKGAAYTLLIHDNYPEILVATEKTTPTSFLFRTISFFNRWLYKLASKIIVVGRDMRELLLRKTAGLDIPIATIPNWAELESVSPSPRDSNELLKELGLSDTFVVLYAGNMGHPNDLESIVDAAEKLRDRSDIHFVFLGTGVKRKWLEKRVAELELANVTILDPRPRSEQRVFLNACDIALVSLVGKMVGVSMPSLAQTEAGSEVAQVVEEDDAGWTVPPGDGSKLAETILEIEGEKARLGPIGEAARKSALEKYSLETALERYRKEL